MNKINSEIMLKMNKSFELTQMKSYCISNYTSSVKNFLYFNEGNIQSIESLDLPMVKEFLSYMLNNRKLKIGTINNYRSALKYLFEIVLEKKWCDKQIPFLSGYKTLPTVLSKSSVLELVKSTENIMFATLFLTVFASGIRISEALNLRFSDIDSIRMQINIRESKNGSSRKAILAKKNLEELREYYKNWWLKGFGKFEKEDYLFCLTKKNIKVSYTSALKAFGKAANRAGLPPKATIHSIRHGFATYLLEKRTPIETIKELLGHNSLRSTLLYTKLANYSVMGIKSPLDHDDEADAAHEIGTNTKGQKEIED
jgi:integrase/recombinase XerD